VKHISKLYSSDFCQSAEIVATFKKLLTTIIADMCPKLVRELALKKLHKMVK
jgi:hypothetical protein